jgi:adenosylcobinamide-GDP ribazoletransferase
MGLMLAVLLSLVALSGLSGPARASALLLAPVVGRLAPLLVGTLFPAATPGAGSGAAFLESLPRSAALFHGALVLALSGILLGGGGLAMVATGLAVALAWSAFTVRRLGGITGDGLGAGVELAELAVLLAASAKIPLTGG